MLLSSFILAKLEPGTYLLSWQVDEIYGYYIWLANFDGWGGELVDILQEDKITPEITEKHVFEHDNLFTYHKCGDIATGRVIVVG